MCVKIKQGAEVFRKQYAHQKKVTAKLSQNFSAAKNFMPRNSEGYYESKSYTYIQS